MNKYPDKKNSALTKINKQKLKIPSGVIHSTWEKDAPFTQSGYLAFFSEYLCAGGIFSNWVDDCPLEYSSNNAPKVRDVLGTAVLSVLSGHKRYSHAAELFGDHVAAEMMGLDKIVSHDSFARGLHKIDREDGREWMQKHLLKTYEPLLRKSYILDIDPTIKQVYGHQEGAEIGYNPTKRGRPSLCHHTYCVANLRLLLDVDIKAGNQTSGSHSHPRLWSLLDELPKGLHPEFVRGDIGFGNEATMAGCEDRGVKYLFKLRQSPNVKKLLKELSYSFSEWEDGTHGWKSTERRLRLQGWTKDRRVIIYRRQKRKKEVLTSSKLPLADKDQLELPLAILTDDKVEYEWRILVTDLTLAHETIAQLYRDRADCENIFDELKNQWGWGGFMSQELKQTQLMARIVAMVYNWWNIFCRLGNPQKHMEATTSRPIFQKIIGRFSLGGRQRKIRLCATGDKADWVMNKLTQINAFIQRLLTATQLSRDQIWCKILEKAFVYFLGNDTLQPVADGDQPLLLL